MVTSSKFDQILGKRSKSLISQNQTNTTIVILSCITQGWFEQTSFLGGVEGSNGSVWPSEGPGF